MGTQAKPVDTKSVDVGRSRSTSTQRSLTPDSAVQAAQEAGLVYASDFEPGIRRVRKGRGFAYLDPHGKQVTDAGTLDRILNLAIPPAWKDVWICIRPRGHLQATGRDARGRKQSRYHARWHKIRDADKFARLLGFARALPRIRRRVTRDLRQRGLPREKVVATVVRLLELTFARIGNEEYARQNGSFGLTTLRDRHVKVQGSTVRFLFKGKSGREVEVGVTNRRVAGVVKRCEELPGQMLFQYIDPAGDRRTVTSDDVNQYLREVSGEDYTAKDFRTWGATVLAAAALREVVRFESDTEAKHNVVAAIDTVARRLGHTRAVCRRSYVHPAVIDTYLEGSLESVLRVVDGRTHRNLKAEESAVIALLKQHVARR
ncbi:MAG: DNA topoisomerase IB [Candidatus Dormibacteraceae bacterium]